MEPQAPVPWGLQTWLLPTMICLPICSSEEAVARKEKKAFIACSFHFDHVDAFVCRVD